MRCSQGQIGQVFEVLSSDEGSQTDIISAADASPDNPWLDEKGPGVMTGFELGLEKPDSRRAVVSAVTIGGSYAVGGIVPLAPYFLISDAHTALVISAIVTVMALAVFGFVKGRFSSARPLVSAVQTVVIGGRAAGAAFALARAIS